MPLDLQELGITSDELIDLVVERMCEQLLMRAGIDEDGDSSRESPLRVRLDAEIKKRIDNAVTDLADNHIGPKVIEHIESLKIVKTNSWGEPKSDPLT